MTYLFRVSFVICLSFSILSCAQRGYKELAVAVPEYFPNFDINNYHIVKSDEKIIYYSKALPAKDSNEIKNFKEENYQYIQRPNSYAYYKPIARQPSSTTDFENFETIETLISDDEALLIK